MPLIDSLGTTEPLADLFSDRSVLEAMLDFEVALARAAADAGAIPQRAAETIAAAARPERFDAAALGREARRSATIAIPLVAALVDQVRAVDPESAAHVHWAATSQDVSDSALLMLLRRAQVPVAADHARVARALRHLSEAHAGTVMLGRTLLQPATPVTFGLKAAVWHAAIVRSWGRLLTAWNDALVLQFGGAAGTRAAAGGRGAAVAATLAREVGLAEGPPWHTDRDRLGAFVAALALYTAALGKAARDVALLMQSEVGEVAERGGGSSAMPHKRNPSGCALVLAAATRMPGLAAAYLGGMLQEHERAVGGGQAEWPTIAAAVQAAGAAAGAMAAALEGLTVDAARMRENLESTRGRIFAERAMVLLAPALGREVAEELVADALRSTRSGSGRFGDALRGMPEVRRVIDPAVLTDIDRPELYLGEAEGLRRQLLGAGAGLVPE